MAKIPRINQGDRPSSVSGTVVPSAASYMAQGAQILGGLVRTGLEVATAEELAERKRLAEAMAAKQAIVDAAEIGRLDMEFDDEKFKDMAAIEQDASIPWAKKVDVFMERAQERADSIRNRNDLNDSVKLSAVKNANASINSGLAQMHNMVQAGLSRKAKADMTAQFNLAAAGAADQPNAAAVEGYAKGAISKMATVGRLAFGAEWGVKEQELRNGIASRYAARTAMYDPLRLLEEMKSSKFLRSSLTEAEQTAAESAARNGYAKINDTRNLEIAAQAFAAGETLARVLGTEEFIDAAAARRKSLEDERRWAKMGIDSAGRKMLPEDAKIRVSELDKQIKRVEVLQEMNYKQLDPPSVDDADTKQELMSAHDKLFESITDTSARENIDGLLDLQDKLERARSQKKLTKATYDTMKTSVFNAFNGLREAQEGKYDWWPFQKAERAGNKVLKNHFRSSYANQPLEVQNRVWTEYLRELSLIGNKVTPAEAVAIANKVISLETGREVPGAFR